MGLCRLWRRQRKLEPALALLDAVYGWFSEGLDMTDLQDARALMAELASTD